MLKQDEEVRLAGALVLIAPRIEGHLNASNFTGALKELAGLRGDVDAFFDKVLVNAEDESLRRNRLALLTELGALMNRVADISKLAA